MISLVFLFEVLNLGCLFANKKHIRWTRGWEVNIWWWISHYHNLALKLSPTRSMTLCCYRYGVRVTTEECPVAVFVMSVQSIVGVIIQVNQGRQLGQLDSMPWIENANHWLLRGKPLLFLDAKVIYFELCKISIFLLQDPDIDVRSVLERMPI